MQDAPLVAAESLVKTFGRGAAAVRAVDGVDLALRAGQTLGIVGESASGKTTLARLLVGLYPADGGRVLWQGRDLATLSSAERMAASRDVQMVFQDPQASLNPRQTAGQIIDGPLRWHRAGDSHWRQQRVGEVLADVGLDAVAATRWPHQFSGGQRQRIGIARALVLRPRLLVLDEPTSALDVSVQAQILNLLQRLRASMQLAWLMISHDLATVRWLCDRVLVMYAGRVVESGAVDTVFDRPRHPYTQALLAAMPRGVPGRRTDPLPAFAGDGVARSGCAFAARCPHAQPACRASVPRLMPCSPDDDDHRAACIVTIANPAHAGQGGGPP